MISFESAKELIFENIETIDICQITLSEANNQVLGEDVFSHRDIPPHRNSAMDGYAFKINGLDNNLLTEKPFKVVGDNFCTKKNIILLSEFECVKVFTGSPLPDNSDTVIPKEEIRIDGDKVFLNLMPKIGSHVRESGEDLKRGELALSSGTLLGPAEIGILVSCRKYLIKVHRKPRIAILPTGDEIFDIDDPEGSDKIIDSNSYILTALLKNLNIESVKLPVCKDDKEELLQAFKIIRSCDGLITTAGISVGDYDFVKEALIEFGAELVFNKIAIKPARPTTFFRYESKPIFCLPGNPVAAMIAFMEVFTPGLKKLMGYKKYDNEYLSAILESPLKPTNDRTHFIRAKSFIKDGVIHTNKLPYQGSGILMSMVMANSLILQPSNSPGLKAGDSALVRLF
jgi:molybdopterin molybdotransferase